MKRDNHSFSSIVYRIAEEAKEQCAENGGGGGGGGL